MRGRIGRTEIIYWINQAASEEITPHAVDCRLGEIGVPDHPLGQRVAGILPRGRLDLRAIEERGSQLDLRARVVDLDAAVDVGIAHFLVLRVIEDHILVAGVPHLEHAPEEGSQTPKLVLAPALVRMVVALSAIESAAQEHANFLSHRLAGRADDIVGEEVPGGTIVACCRQALASYLVVGFVGGDVLPDPVGVHAAPLGSDAIRKHSHTEYVVEPESPVVNELGRSDKRVNQLFALLRIPVGEKFTNTVGRRKLTGQIETKAAQKFAVAR